MADLDLNQINIRMEKSIESFKKDLSGLRVGRASITMLDPINVKAYGSVLPLNQVGTVSVPEARMLTVSIWDNSLVSFAEKAIRESALGLNPMVEGNVIRIAVPPLSEDRRIEIVKVASKYAENAKVSIRNIRRELIENLRKDLKNSDISEDQKHGDELKIQEIIDINKKNIDMLLSAKEKKKKKK